MNRATRTPGLSPMRDSEAYDSQAYDCEAYAWRLREVMDAAGMGPATELRAPLARRGIALSDVAIWRLVTGRPTRLSLPVLAALCDILGCTPTDLIAVRRPKTLTGKGIR